MRKDTSQKNKNKQNKISRNGFYMNIQNPGGFYWTTKKLRNLPIMLCLEILWTWRRNSSQKPQYMNLEDMTPKFIWKNKLSKNSQKKIWKCDDRVDLGWLRLPDSKMYWNTIMQEETEKYNRIEHPDIDPSLYGNLR